MRIGLIMVLTTDDQILLKKQEDVLRQNNTFWEIKTRCIPDQFFGIHNDETERVAEPKILKVARELERESDALFISCASDPAISLVRAHVSVPVVGAGSSCAAVARSLSDKVGVIGLTPEVTATIKRALGDAFWAYQQPDGVVTALDVMKKEGKDALMKAAYKLKNGGAEVIALGCTGMSIYDIAYEISNKFGIQTVDPIIASSCVLMHMSNLRAKSRSVFAATDDNESIIICGGEKEWQNNVEKIRR